MVSFLKSQKIVLTLGKNYRGKRLDKALFEALQGRFSRSFIKDLFSKSLVSVGNIKVKPSYKVKGAEKVLLCIPQADSNISAWRYPLRILYQDHCLAVVDKPSGLVVHPTSTNKTKTLVNALLYRYPKLSRMDTPRPGIVHRLDRDTSGVMVVAFEDYIHSELARQFSLHTIRRQYLALVEGVVRHAQGFIEVPLGRSRKDPTKFKVSFVKAKSAFTRYRVLKRFKHATLLLLEPYTGRTHQLRVHLKFLGHPIIGDPKYHRSQKGVRLCLHAYLLGFVHPQSSDYMEFRSPLPEDFRKILVNKSYL